MSTKDRIGGIIIIALVLFGCTYKYMPTSSEVLSYFKSKPKVPVARIVSTKDIEFQTMSWNQPVKIGVIQDGDDEIVAKWATKNGIEINRDSKTYDPNKINMIGRSTGEDVVMESKVKFDMHTCWSAIWNE